MSILVVGSVALDNILTPFGHATEAIGGSAVYFSASASFFSTLKVTAVVGDDFPRKELAFLEARGVDLKGLAVVKGGKTFRWQGKYDYDLHDAQTLATDLGVFENFHPEVPEAYRDAPFVFLANIDPELQREVLNQVAKPKFVACDTMNYWIESKRTQLFETMSRVQVMVLNDAEVRQLTKEPNLVKAARAVQLFGPRIVIVKKGEHGALMFYEDSLFSAPAYPVEQVMDPTGAGDSFAGGFVGSLARKGSVDEASVRQAMIYGSVMASFCVESFGIERFKTLAPQEIVERYREFQKISHFDPMDAKL